MKHNGYLEKTANAYSQTKWCYWQNGKQSDLEKRWKREFVFLSNIKERKEIDVYILV